MHIERCDVEGCTIERPVIDRKNENPFKMLDIGTDPGWRYVVEVVPVPAELPPDLAKMAASNAFLEDMIMKAASQLQMPKVMTRIVCPNHDGMPWPLRWKQDKDMPVTEYDGFPRDAYGNIIPLD